MKNELHLSEAGNFVTRLSLAFMTAAAHDYKTLVPSNLPATPCAIDVWILRGQDILLTKGWKAEDEIVNMKFDGFKQQIATIFSQTITPTVQPYNQGLVLVDF